MVSRLRVRAGRFGTDSSSYKPLSFGVAVTTAGSELILVDAEIFQKLLAKYNTGKTQNQALKGDLERMSGEFCPFCSHWFFFLPPCF
jgi:hypothetical protein